MKNLALGLIAAVFLTLGGAGDAVLLSFIGGCIIGYLACRADKADRMEREEAR
jgi:hypothetical protein